MADNTSLYGKDICHFQDGYERRRTGTERKRQESNLPKTPARPPTGLKPARPTGSGTLPRRRLLGFSVGSTAAVRRFSKPWPVGFHFYVPRLLHTLECGRRSCAPRAFRGSAE